IDYFKEDTEIHQGMKLVDQKLGGTTPLDIIIDAPKEDDQKAQGGDFDDPFADDFGDDDFADESSADDGFDDPFADDFGDDDVASADAKDNKGVDLENSYWYTPQR